MNEKAFCLWLLGLFDFRNAQPMAGGPLDCAALDMIEAKLRAVLEPKADPLPLPDAAPHLRLFRESD